MQTTKGRNPKYNTRITQVATNAVIVHRNDWRRVKKEAVHLTPEERRQIKQREETAKLEAMQTINKTRASKIDSETKQDVMTRNTYALKTFEERDYALQLADQKADEDLDEVKTINSQMVAALARTERDQQLAIHQKQKEEEKQREKSMAEMLEDNRLRAKNLYDERERSLREQRRRGRAIIDLQRHEHEINAILEAERRDREAKALAENNEKIRQEDLRIKAEAKARQQAFYHDCIAMDEALKHRRAEEKRRDEELAQMTIDFANEKALKEEAREREIRAQKAMKEREIQEIRAKQQRAIDTQAIRDELAAARIQEEKNRADDEREQAELMKKITDAQKLKKDRFDMINTQRLQVLEQQKKDRIEYEKMMAENERKRKEAYDAYLAKCEVDRQYRVELGQEVERREYARKQNPYEKQRELRKIQQEQQEYEARVERIRQKKLEELAAKGVPEKYRRDIEKLSFEIR